MELEEKNKILKERIADEGIDEEFQPELFAAPEQEELADGGGVTRGDKVRTSFCD